MPIDVDAARTFIRGHGRLLDQRACDVAFERADPHDVVRALAAYQNADRGFGNGLEPDKRSPDSQPLDVEVALGYLVDAGAEPPDAFLRAFDFLADVADDEGLVPVLLPTIAGFPRAAHWNELDYPPALNPTASIAGYAHALGLRHGWVDAATASTFAILEGDELPDSAHTLLCVTRFVEHAPDRRRALRLAERIAAALPGSSLFLLRPDADAYGLGPLDFCPTPTSLARGWFTREVLDEHLDHLERQQQRDGGWPIQWQPPTQASACEWRAMRTLDALTTLRAYGRIS